MDVGTKMLHIWFLKDKMEIERQRKQIIMKNLPTIFIESISYLCVSFHARLSYLIFSTGIDFRNPKLKWFWIKWVKNITYRTIQQKNENILIDRYKVSPNSNYFMHSCQAQICILSRFSEIQLCFHQVWWQLCVSRKKYTFKFGLYKEIKIYDRVK